MPLKPHPTDPDKVVYVPRQYDLPTKRLAELLETDGWPDAAAELRRLEHNTTVLMNALMKACGDDEEMVKEIIESQGELK